MEFALTDEQRLLDDSLRGYLSRELTLDTLKATVKDGPGLSDSHWGALAELGLTGLIVPEEYGGSGLGVLDAAVAAEALGYHAAPVAFAGPCVMAPLAVQSMADAGQKADWLPRMAAGEMRVAVAFAADTGQTGVANVSLDDGKLTGRVDSVLDAAGATHVLVILPDGRAALAEVSGKGVTCALKPTLDRTRPLADVSFAGASVAILDASNDPAATVQGVRNAGRVMLAADTLGAAQAMLDKAVAYAMERVQFGRVVASFQAVKHMAAEMATELEPCRALVWFAAHAHDAIPEEAHLAACHAKAHLAEVGRHVQTKATEMHGGMGFTELMGLELWFKRISLDRHVLGGPERCRHEAAVAQGWVKSQA
ncbi:MAG: acyl-CoA dehydrogenase family protein [Hyphomicrobiaceae bacterium]